MAVHRIDADAAWAALHRASNHSNIRLRAIADAIVTITMSPEAVPDTPAATAVIRHLLPTLGLGERAAD
jgi:hypothetical protein